MKPVNPTNSQRPSIFIAHRSSFIVLCLVLLPLTSGCNIIGAMAYKLSGPPKVEPKYELPAVPTLVLAESYDNSSASSQADVLAMYVQDKLHEKQDSKDKDDKKRAPPLIDQDVLADLKSRNPASFHKLSIPQIGKSLGAKQIIYIDFQGGGVHSMGGATVQGQGSAMVRVVDCVTGETLWPKGNAQGQPVSFSTEMHRTDEVTTDNLQAETYDGLAENIVNLFFQWQMKE